MRALFMCIVVLAAARAGIKVCGTFDDIAKAPEGDIWKVAYNKMQTENKTVFFPSVNSEDQQDQRTTKLMSGFVCEEKYVGSCEDYIALYEKLFEEQKSNFRCYVEKSQNGGTSCSNQRIAVFTNLDSDVSFNLFNTNSYLLFNSLMRDVFMAINESVEREFKLVLTKGDLEKISGIEIPDDNKAPSPGVLFISLWGAYEDATSSRRRLVPRLIDPTVDFYSGKPDDKIEDYIEAVMDIAFVYLKEVYEQSRSCDLYRTIFQLNVKRDFLEALNNDTSFPTNADRVNMYLNSQSISAADKHKVKMTGLLYKYCSGSLMLNRSLLATLITHFSSIMNSDQLLDEPQKKIFKELFLNPAVGSEGSADSGLLFSPDEIKNGIQEYAKNKSNIVAYNLVDLVREDLAEYIDNEKYKIVLMDTYLKSEKYKGKNDKNIPKNLLFLLFEYYFIMGIERKEKGYEKFDDYGINFTFNNYIIENHPMMLDAKNDKVKRKFIPSSNEKNQGLVFASEALKKAIEDPTSFVKTEKKADQAEQAIDPEQAEQAINPEVENVGEEVNGAEKNLEKGNTSDGDDSNDLIRKLSKNVSNLDGYQSISSLRSRQHRPSRHNLRKRHFRRMHRRRSIYPLRRLIKQLRHRYHI